MDPSKVQLYEPVADSDDANAHPVSGADEYIVHITFELQTANTARDSGQSASLLVDLLRHAPAISQQGPDLQKVLQLIQVTAQALPCCRSNSQVEFPWQF